MKITQQLQEVGQSLWLDNITRDLLDSGGLQRYVDELSITGLTSNPTIFERAIEGTHAYDAALGTARPDGPSDEELFIGLALEDLRRAAEIFRPIFESSAGADGWVSMEVSPLLASDTAGTVRAAAQIFRQAARPNLFVKIPGTPAGLPAIEESIFAGIPVNVTLLFSREQYLAAAAAYQRGVERRLAAGLHPRVASVASLFVSRWDQAVADSVPAHLRSRLGIAISGSTYRAYRDLLASGRWQALRDQGARPQRLLWASTGTKDPGASDTLYVEALAAPCTVNTMPEKTLHAFAAHGKLGATLDRTCAGADATLALFADAGIDIQTLAGKLQRDGADAFVKSWQQLLRRIAARRAHAPDPVSSQRIENAL